MSYCIKCKLTTVHQNYFNEGTDKDEFFGVLFNCIAFVEGNMVL